MKKTIFIATMVLSITLSCAYGQEGKIGFVDVGQVFEKYQKTQDLNTKMQQERKEKIAERKVMVEEINKLKDEADLLRDDAKKKKEELVDEKVKALYQFEERVKREAMQKQVKLQEEILMGIEEAIEEVAKSEGYDIIFAITEEDIGYHADRLDLTEAVVKLLNKRYSKKK